MATGTSSRLGLIFLVGIASSIGIFPKEEAGSRSIVQIGDQDDETKFGSRFRNKPDNHIITNVIKRQHCVYGHFRYNVKVKISFFKTGCSLKRILGNIPSDDSNFHFFYSKLQKNPQLRKSLGSLNTARWSVSTDLAHLDRKTSTEKVLTNVKIYVQMRIAVRFGQKSNIDF